MQSGNEIWPVYAILLNDFFYQKIMAWPGTSSSKKDSVKVSMLIWTNFDRFAITYLT